MTIQIDCTSVRKIARLAALLILPMTALTASAQSCQPTGPCADLAVFNTVANPNSGTYEFIITVVNNGPTAADNVVLSNILPDSGWTFEKVVFNPKKVSCPNPPVGFDVCHTDRLEAGAGFSVAFVLKVTGPSGTITDTARAQSEPSLTTGPATPDPNPVNNEASDTITHP